MIQPFTTDDLLRIRHLQPDGWQDIGSFLRFYVNDQNCRAYKIEDEHRIVAIGAFILHAQTAWLAHIIVAPEVRRKGLGVLMTRHLIESAESHGRATQLLIATKMGQPLYGQLGFHRSCDYLFYDLPTGIEDTYRDGVQRMEPADIPEILDLDREASGEDRQSLLSSSFKNALVHRGGGSVRGYYLPNLGEGLVVARDAEAGQALMHSRMADTDTAPVLPDGNHAAHQWLKDTGLAVKSTAARMVRNGKDGLRQDLLFNRIGGHLG